MAHGGARCWVHSINQVIQALIPSVVCLSHSASRPWRSTVHDRAAPPQCVTDIKNLRVHCDHIQETSRSLDQETNMCLRCSLVLTFFVCSYNDTVWRQRIANLRRTAWCTGAPLPHCTCQQLVAQMHRNTKPQRNRALRVFVVCCGHVMSYLVVDQPTSASTVRTLSGNKCSSGAHAALCS